MFCQVVGGGAEAAIVYQDAVSVAFLDHKPLFPGHLLLVPKLHVETLVDLPAPQVAPLFTAAQLLAAAVRKAMDAEGSFVAINNIVSQSVPHLHIHVVPRRKGDGLKGFFWPRQKYRDEEHLRNTQQRLIEALAS